MWVRFGLWLANTRTGRIVAAAAGLAAAIAVALLKAFSAGKDVERAKQDRASLDNLRNRHEVENEIDALAPDDLDRRGRRWVRPESDG